MSLLRCAGTCVNTTLPDWQVVAQPTVLGSSHGNLLPMTRSLQGETFDPPIDLEVKVLQFFATT